METSIIRLSLNGQAVRFERAKLVMFVGWRLVVAGATVRDPLQATVPVDFTVEGARYAGTVRPGTPPQPAGDGAGTTLILMGVGDLRRVA